METARRFQDQPIVCIKLMQFLKLIEQLERELRDMEHMLRLRFQFVHETEKFLARFCLIHFVA